jgi:FtsP/CotA-like multicopper oxidase with cupredoxin domain
VTLCEIAPAGDARNDDGSPAAASYAAGDVPSLERTGRTNEGQTVLTNGMNVGGRAGSPSAPGALAAGAHRLNVLSGQGLRLQIVNCTVTRYFRLILTTSTGAQVPLARVGGEGGLLDNAVVEGGVIGGFDTKFTPGEILLPPGSRADVVAAIPTAATGVLTLWTQDFARTGTGFSNLPTVPVMHLNVTGAAAAPYTIADGTPLRASIPGAAVETLGPPNGALLDPATFVPVKPGMSSQDIQLTTPPGINGVVGMFDGFTPYTSAPHIASSRYAEPGRTLELRVTNNSNAHHPFHLHGFSFQPISLTRPGFPTYTWPYREFRDNIDLPANYTLTFRVRLDDRELKDGVTLGGALGRWFFHCHIFFHHHQGMISEVVVTAADGSEKPNVDVRGSWAYTPSGGIATRDGTYSHPDGDPVTLTASLGTVTVTGPGKWSWELDSTGMPPQTKYVYITTTDSAGRQDQAVFRLKIGAPDDGADNGDPHVHTVDGKRYDFQAVGEFTLLRDRDGMEVQARHWPVQTATPITDSYSGLTSCVSVNTAVAARVGSHRIAYQPGREGRLLQFYLDGEPAPLPVDGLDLDAHRVTAYAVAGGATALRVDYAHHAVLTITPYFWNSYNIWILNVSVSHTHGDEGIMGRIPEGSWFTRAAQRRDGRPDAPGPPGSLRGAV